MWVLADSGTFEVFPWIAFNDSNIWQVQKPREAQNKQILSGSGRHFGERPFFPRVHSLRIKLNNTRVFTRAGMSELEKIIGFEDNRNLIQAAGGSSPANCHKQMWETTIPQSPYIYIPVAIPKSKQCHPCFFYL